MYAASQPVPSSVNGVQGPSDSYLQPITTSAILCNADTISAAYSDQAQSIEGQSGSDNESIRFPSQPVPSFATFMQGIHRPNSQPSHSVKSRITHRLYYLNQVHIFWIDL